MSEDQDKAVKFIRKNLTAYTPEIAKHMRMSQKATDELLKPLVGDELVSCNVIKGGRRMIQYRRVGVEF